MANKSPYQQPLNDLYAAYHSGREGLSTTQANQNREQFGKNQLAQKKKKPVWMIFLEQFKDFLVIILIIAAIISAITGELESTIVILVVITMNAILGTVQTVKAEKSLDNLKSLSAPHAKVLRDGTTVLLPAAELVVGDVILLEAGDQVPADARIVEAAGRPEEYGLFRRFCHLWTGCLSGHECGHGNRSRKDCSVDAERFRTQNAFAADA